MRGRFPFDERRVILLGSVFAGRLTKPIREMTDSALLMASGNLDAPLISSRRRDDLGILSRSMANMSENISHRIKSMQTMNQIDRAVLSSLSRKELMYKVSSNISDLYNREGVTVLEKIEEGYQIIATAPQREGLNYRIIKDKSLPEKLMINAQVPFEFVKGSSQLALHWNPVSSL